MCAGVPALLMTTQKYELCVCRRGRLYWSVRTCCFFCVVLDCDMSIECVLYVYKIICASSACLLVWIGKRPAITVRTISWPILCGQRQRHSDDDNCIWCIAKNIASVASAPNQTHACAPRHAHMHCIIYRYTPDILHAHLCAWMREANTPNTNTLLGVSDRCLNYSAPVGGECVLCVCLSMGSSVPKWGLLNVLSTTLAGFGFLGWMTGRVGVEIGKYTAHACESMAGQVRFTSLSFAVQIIVIIEKKCHAYLQTRYGCEMWFNKRNKLFVKIFVTKFDMMNKHEHTLCSLISYSFFG